MKSGPTPRNFRKPVCSREGPGQPKMKTITRLSRWQPWGSKSSTGSSERRAPCDSTPHLPLKLALKIHGYGLRHNLWFTLHKQHASSLWWFPSLLMTGANGLQGAFSPHNIPCNTFLNTMEQASFHKELHPISPGF